MAIYKIHAVLSLTKYKLYGHLQNTSGMTVDQVQVVWPFTKYKRHDP